MSETLKHAYGFILSDRPFGFDPCFTVRIVKRRVAEPYPTNCNSDCESSYDQGPKKLWGHMLDGIEAKLWYSSEFGYVHGMEWEFTEKHFIDAAKARAIVNEGAAFPCL